MSTWAITGSSVSARDWLAALLPELGWECVDAATFNVTVPDSDDDDVVEWAEDNGLGCELI